MPLYIRTVASGLVALLVVAAAQSQPMKPVMQQPQKANIGMQSLLDSKAALGLGDADAFKFATPFTDELGHTHVRVQQLYKGVRVWGGDGVVHVGATGEVGALTNNLAPRLALSVTPGIDAARARALAVKHLGFKGTLSGEPTVELVVYPNPGGPRIQARWDKTQRRFVQDSQRSVFGRREAGARGMVADVDIDVNDDTELDATDLGNIALAYGSNFWSPTPPTRYDQKADLAGGGLIDDLDIEVYIETFRAYTSQ